MPQNRKNIVYLLDGLIFVIGMFIGLKLALHGTFEVFKLFNIVGLIFDLIGVVILTYLITSNELIKEIITSWFAFIAAGFLGFMPMGLFLGAAYASSFLGINEIDRLFEYYLPIMLYSLASFYFIEETVLSPTSNYFKSQDVRVKACGGFFIISGLLIQLYAAVLDFLT